MDGIIGQIANLENLYWAWEKTKYSYKLSEGSYDEIELAEFEANLVDELELIRKRLKEGSFETSPIRPVPFPKPPDDNGPRNRQSFWIAPRDQVTWLAVLNIIGPYLDYMMPFWSYGNRLYISVFYEPNEPAGRMELKFGWYRHTSKYTYRKWNQSWPMYRRHIAITARIMAHQEKYVKHTDAFIEEELEDEREQEILEQNKILPPHLKVRYLEKEYWNKKLSGKVFWKGIDFEKFYPRINPNTILINFKKYFPNEHASKELEQVVGSLLQFPINYQGWEKEEQLERIELKEKPKYLKGIPTGLFTAGFLANVALLDVDALVREELEKRKNIAHFRFVDDHVFLADDFGALCGWISTYEKLLMDLNTGAIINWDKTEPHLCGQCCKKRGSACTGPDTTEECADAMRGSVLDPQFLSPLMTQTLTKISNIAQTDFELLDESEEEKLISDIEHLLLTDFPDQELRRDTRVSFAASMLTKLVPRKEFDLTELYKIEKKIMELEETKREAIQLLKKTREMAGDYDVIKRRLQGIENKITATEREKKIRQEELEREEIAIRRHTFKLLLKAIKDNHEKIRLWTKTLEYCLMVGEDQIDELFKLLKQLEEEGKINSLSAGFIHSLILQTLANLLTRSYRVIESMEYSNRAKERAIKFVRGAIGEGVILEAVSGSKDSMKCYEMLSRDLFVFSTGSVLHLLLEDIHESEFIDKNEIRRKYEHLVKKYGVVSWESGLADFVNKTKYSIGSWSWWVIRKTNDAPSKYPNVIWKDAVGILPGDSPVDWAVIALYPRYIALEVIKQIIKRVEATKYINEEGWIFDVLQALGDEGQVKRMRFSNKRIHRISSIMRAKWKNYMTIQEWANWTQTRFDEITSSEKPSFDPRISEWTALEAIRQIAELVVGEIGIIPLATLRDLRNLSNDGKSPICKLHPSNYLVPKEWQAGYGTLTWDDWRRVILENKIRQRAKKDLISDIRYTPTIKNAYDENDKELSVINGLGVLLLGLLRRDFELPPFWNPVGLERVWATMAKVLLSGHPVSSWTYGIIEACFSKRNLETRLIKVFQKEVFEREPADDTVYDPPVILTVQEFINQVKKAQVILGKYQLTVQEHQPRQLIPVSLIQLTREYNPYEEIRNE